MRKVFPFDLGHHSNSFLPVWCSEKIKKRYVNLFDWATLSHPYLTFSKEGSSLLGQLDLHWVVHDHTLFLFPAVFYLLFFLEHLIPN